MERMNQDAWVSTAGGPFILISRKYLHLWNGVLTAEFDANILDADLGTDVVSDYDRACEIVDYVGLVTVGNGCAIVLSGDPFATTWHATEDENGLILRWGYGESEREVIALAEQCPEDIWVDSEFKFTVDDALLLFDSGSPSDQIEEYFQMEIQHGGYRIQTAEYKPNSSTFLIMHRFVRL